MYGGCVIAKYQEDMFSCAFLKAKRHCVLLVAHDESNSNCYCSREVKGMFVGLHESLTADFQIKTDEIMHGAVRTQQCSIFAK